MRRAAACALVMLVSAAATALTAAGLDQTPPAAAIDGLIGKPIASVRLTLEGRPVTEASLSEIVETRVGSPLSMIEVRESITHLFSLGRFENVRLHANPEAAGIALIYELVPIHPVSRIEFRGAVNQPGIDEGQMRHAIVDLYGVSPPLGRVTELARIVEDSLKQNGYLHATAVPSAEVEHNPDQATLVFTITPGSRTAVGDVQVVGAPSVTKPELLAKLDLAPGKPYRRDALAQRIDSFVESRRARGYYEAKVVPAVRLRDNDRLADITLTVTPGPRVRVVFTGEPLPAERRADLVPVEREGSIDEDLLEDSSHGIEEFLKGQGYDDAKATYTRAEHDDELVITFDVHRGPLYRVQQYEISGNTSVTLATLAPLLHVHEHQPFAAANLAADASAIETFYRREGFGATRVQAGVDPQPAEGAEIPVVVRVVVRESVRTVVESVRVIGNSALSADDLVRPLGLQPGRPFFAPQMSADRDAMLARYADAGFPDASVDANPGVSADGSRADVVFTVREGPQVFVDHILVTGNLRTGNKTILREMQLRPGDPLSAAAVNESQRRLAALGLFRRARINELQVGNENRRDLIVSVEEAPSTTISYGGGFEVRSLLVSGSPTAPPGASVATSELEFAPRASFSIGRRNLFGKNRSVDLFTSVSVHPNQIDVAGQPSYTFPEYRLVGTFREPRIFDTPADALVTGEFEQQLRASFDFTRRSATAEVGRRLTRSLSVSGNYQIQTVTLLHEHLSPGDEQIIDRVFPQFLLSLFSASGIHDTRDDQVNPTRGGYVSVNGQIAARAIGSEVGFGKTYVTGQLFKTIPRSRGIVFAGSARLGMAAGFPREVTTVENGQILVTEVKDLPASERFFAGGDTTVRGFAQDQLGTRETIVDGFPKGGNGLIIFNAEARVPVRGGFGVVGFVDTGNVFASVTDIALGDLRSSAGFGIRYKSPIGPIRVDLGFKLHRLDGEALTALHISLGQAF